MSGNKEALKEMFRKRVAYAFANNLLQEQNNHLVLPLDSQYPESLRWGALHDDIGLSLNTDIELLKNDLAELNSTLIDFEQRFERGLNANLSRLSIDRAQNIRESLTDNVLMNLEGPLLKVASVIDSVNNNIFYVIGREQQINVNAAVDSIVSTPPVPTIAREGTRNLEHTVQNIEQIMRYRLQQLLEPNNLQENNLHQTHVKKEDALSQDAQWKTIAAEAAIPAELQPGMQALEGRLLNKAKMLRAYKKENVAKDKDILIEAWLKDPKVQSEIMSVANQAADLGWEPPHMSTAEQIVRDTVQAKLQDENHGLTVTTATKRFFRKNILEAKMREDGGVTTQANINSQKQSLTENLKDLLDNDDAVGRANTDLIAKNLDGMITDELQNLSQKELVRGTEYIQSLVLTRVMQRQDLQGCLSNIQPTRHILSQERVAVESLDPSEISQARRGSEMVSVVGDEMSSLGDVSPDPAGESQSKKASRGPG